MQVNPNTVQRAYMGLEQEGLIYTLRGQRSYVTDDRSVLLALKKSMLHSIVTGFIQEIEAVGMEKKDVLKLLEPYLRQEGEL